MFVFYLCLPHIGFVNVCMWTKVQPSSLLLAQENQLDHAIAASSNCIAMHGYSKNGSLSSTSGKLPDSKVPYQLRVKIINLK